MSAAPRPDRDPPEEEISLEALTEAFAQVMGRGAPQSADGLRDDLPEAPQGSPDGECLESEPSVDEEPQHTAEALPLTDDAGDISPLSVLEAMLFVGDRTSEPLAAGRAAELMRGVEAAEICDLVEQLNRRYAANGCPYCIVGEGGGYRMTLRPEFASIRSKFYGRLREARLSQAAIDMLAIVAYRQPITAEEVSALRGTPSGAILAQLVRRRLLQVERPAEKPRTPRYRTAARFLQLFGLESLNDLPQSDDLETR